MIDKERLELIAKAKQQIADGSLMIWNERLATLVRAGDVAGAIAQLAAPIENWGDNCGCGNNCPSASDESAIGRMPS